LGAAEQVHQPALAEAQPEQVGECGLQPLGDCPEIGGL
jgi:hypothetical protein